MELETLADDELSALRVGVATEQERRLAIATIPNQIRELTAKYVAGGGNPDDLNTPEK